jgi:Putative restriction endonuclease
MTNDRFTSVAERPTVDYAHLPGEEENPLMESTLHVDWGLVLLNSARHTLSATNDLITGNVPFAPDDGGPHTAPDIMVIPGAAGTDFGRYEPGPDRPLPSACIEILSPSNRRTEINRRVTRLLRLGVEEVYVLDPVRETVVRVTEHNGSLIETSAIGSYSPALRFSFATSDGRLAVCCPGGRMVRPGDDPFGWLVEEMRRADIALTRADDAAAQALAATEQAKAAIAQANTATTQAEAATAQAEAATAQAEAATAQAEAATARAREAEGRATALEAELHRLRGSVHDE